MKTFLLLTSLLAVALVSQAAEVKLTLDDSLGKALLDLASGGQQKREEEGDDNQHASLDVSDTNEKREMEAEDVKDESLDWTNENYQAQKREIEAVSLATNVSTLQGVCNRFNIFAEGDDNQHASLDVSDTNEKREMGNGVAPFTQIPRHVKCLNAVFQVDKIQDSQEAEDVKDESLDWTNENYQAQKREIDHYRHCTHHPSRAEVMMKLASEIEERSQKRIPSMGKLEAEETVNSELLRRLKKAEKQMISIGRTL
ncbi:UNVERIFIED_CONTAM: hypothetical protein FKN15_069183 [Acipenser sinensis]